VNVQPVEVETQTSAASVNVTASGVQNRPAIEDNPDPAERGQVAASPGEPEDFSSASPTATNI
jgi:hypothetical protein